MEPPNFGFGGAFPESPPSEPCDYTQVLAADLEPYLGVAGARFIGFFEEGIVGELPTGETFLVFWPSGGLVRMPEDDTDLLFRDSSAGYVLACSPVECALLEQDPVRPGFLRRIPGGTVPGGGDWSWLRWDSYLLCAIKADGVEICFDRIAWTTSDGGVVSGTSSADAGLPDGGSAEGGAPDGGPDASSLSGEGGSDASSLSGEAGSDASFLSGEGGGSDAGLGAAPPPVQATCGPPIYCDSPDVAGDPLCLYEYVAETGWLWGATVSGRMVEARYDGSGSARCTLVTPPFGAPVGLGSAMCGISDHIVLLTADGLYETCGCAVD